MTKDEKSAALQKIDELLERAERLRDSLTLAIMKRQARIAEYKACLRQLEKIQNNLRQ